MNTPTIAVAAALLVALAPTALADFGGAPDAALFGLCKAYEASEAGREASADAGSRGNSTENNGTGAEDAPPFAYLEERAAQEGQSTEEFCASQQPPGAPEGLPSGPDDAPDGAPGGIPTGPPEGTPGPGSAPQPPQQQPPPPPQEPGPR